jgi:hypothetical protein
MAANSSANQFPGAGARIRDGVESRAIQSRMRNWKTLTHEGGGILGNFVSHCFHYLEWFCGPIAQG